jgi:hypothetical protein
MLVHVVLIVGLSMIALDAETRSELASLFVTQQQPESTILSELPAFNMTAAAEIDELVPTPLVPNLEVQVPSPMLASKPVDARLGPLGSEAEAAAPLHGVAAKAAAVIRGRVNKAGGQPGEVQFALAWRNTNDLDLHVITPSGEQISYMRRVSSCAGNLDVDMNVRGESNEPVENVRWLTNAPWGRFTVVVNLYRVHASESGRGGKTTPFQLLAQLGKEAVLREGAIRPSSQVVIFRFHYFPDSLSSVQREDLSRRLAEQQVQEEAAASALLLKAKRVSPQSDRDKLLRDLVRTYPHTDATVQALRIMGENAAKL